MSTSLQRRAALGALAVLPFAARTAFAATAADDIVIGQSAHLTGPLASTLKGVLKGQDLAIDDFNRKGGVGGRKVRLVTLDEAGEVGDLELRGPRLLLNPGSVGQRSAL